MMHEDRRGRRRPRGTRSRGRGLAAAVCLECGSTTTLIPIADDGVSICLGCVSTLLDGCIPEHVGWGEISPVYWWWCVCGRQVRDSRFTVDVAGLSERQAWEVERYRLSVAGVPSGGVMLCAGCAHGAGDPLPAPAPARAPNVIDLVARRAVRRRDR